MKKFTVLFLTALLLFIPSVSSAATLEELREQLRVLLEQIANLEASVAPTTSSVPLRILPADTSGAFRVLTPNGGEQWELGTMNTITWAPYGYDPDINPATDVEAYLEKKSGRGFRVVGKVVPSGKASIHWETDIDTYGKYPTPGKYYIRVLNTKTKQWDRSNKPFTLTPRSVDLKVNGSNGPVTLAFGEKVKFSWTAKGPYEKCDVYGIGSEQYGDAVMYGLSPNGSQTGYYNYAQDAQISLYCYRDGGSIARADWVDVHLSGEPVTQPTPLPEAALDLVSPNGGEKFDPAKPMDITFKSIGISSASIALYKNDTWKYWIQQNVEPSAKDLSSVLYTWTPSAALTGLGFADNAGEIFKIYITGKKTNGEGYVDDKSDRAFSFAPSTTVVPPPVCTLATSYSSSLISGDPVRIQWTSANADYAILPGGDKGATSGSATYYPTVTTTYTYMFVGPGGKTACSKTVIVDDAGTETTTTLATPTVSLTASPQVVQPKGKTALTWTSKNAQRCVLQTSLGEEYTVLTSGSKAFYPLQTTTYKLWCANDPGTGKDGPAASATVTVWVAEYYIDSTGGTGGGSGERALLQQASALAGLQSAREQVMALLEKVQALLHP